MKIASLIILGFYFPINLFAQIDSVKSKLSFNGDFRFRIEQDWNSKESDGSFREDRSRLRYRLRAGVFYSDKWYKSGFQIRTGNPRKQQDPQLTLGEGFEEFGTLPIGLEKAFFQGKLKSFEFWIGKNTFPFQKNNELFWSDNVFPEGVYIGRSKVFNSAIFDSIDVKAGHFIISASGGSFNQDNYFQGYQSYISLFKTHLELFPSFYVFKNMPNIPDGNETFEIDYNIFHLGTSLNLLKNKLLSIQFDYYRNIQEYSQNDSIQSRFKQQKSGAVIGLKYGELKQKGDWLFTASYAYLEQYSTVDIMAQNDWARWDYSSFGSPDGRLTNMEGIELVVGFKLEERINLITKYYRVKQLVPYGSSKETGSRIRFDLDMTF